MGKIKAFITLLHQCRFGGVAVKPTMILSNDDAVRSMALKCNHRNKHAAAIGLDALGNFITTPLARYPSQLCEAIADRIASFMYTDPGQPSDADVAFAQAVARGRQPTPLTVWLFPAGVATPSRRTGRSSHPQFQQ